jgi:hypothetical protein
MNREILHVLLDRFHPKVAQKKVFWVFTFIVCYHKAIRPSQTTTGYKFLVHTTKEIVVVTNEGNQDKEIGFLEALTR